MIINILMPLEKIEKLKKQNDHVPYSKYLVVEAKQYPQVLKKCICMLTGLIMMNNQYVSTSSGTQATRFPSRFGGSFWGKCARAIAAAAMVSILQSNVYGTSSDFHLNGNASVISSSAIQLTADLSNRASTALSNATIDLTQAFDLKYRLYFGNHVGADGIGFILHNDPRGKTALGKGGGSIGFSGAGAITNSVAIRWSSYGTHYTQIYRSATFNEIMNNSVISGGEAIVLSNLTNGTWYPVRIKWDPSSYTLTQIFNNTITQSVNLGAAYASTYFGGSSNVYYGLGAGTGGATNLQKFQIMSDTLDLLGSNSTLTDNDLNYINIISTSNTPDLAVNLTTEHHIISGNILSPIRHLIKNGSRTLTLSGTNTHTGTTTISAGILQIGEGTTGSISNNSNIANNAALLFNRSNAYTYSGVISGSGTVTKTGAGTLTLSGANTYTGTTTISAGILNISAANCIGSGLSTLTLAGGTLQVGGSFTLNRAITLTPSTNSTVDTQSNTTTLNGVINGSGNFTKSGAGTLTLSGANTYTGTTTISAGILNISAANCMGSGLSTLTLAGGTLQVGGSFTLNRAITLTPSTNSTVDTQSNTTTLNGVINGSGNFTKSGTGTLTLSGANTYTGTTTISAGTLQIGAGSTTGSIHNSSDIANNAALLFNRSNAYTYLGVISGSGTVTKIGAGALTLSGANTYTGDTNIVAGTLIGQISSALSLSNNTTYYLGAADRTLASISDVSNSTICLCQNASDTTARTLTLSNSSVLAVKSVLTGAGGLTKTGVGALTLSGENTYTGTTTISAGTLQIGAGSTTGSIHNSSDIANNASLLFNRSNAYTYSGVISGSGTVTKTGAGTLTLSGENTYTGTTAINVGILIGDISSSSSVTVPGTYDLNGTDQTIKNPSGLGTIQSSGGGAALTITSTNESTFSGTLASTINGLTKNGSSTLILSGANANTGAITVSAGTLELASPGAANSTNNPTIALSTGATLKSSIAAAFANPITFTGSTVTINATAATTFSGSLTGTTGALTINGGQNITLSGTQSGAFTITVSGANTKLIVPQAVALSTGKIAIGANASFQSTGFRIMTNAITFE